MVGLPERRLRRVPAQVLDRRRSWEAVAVEVEEAVEEVVVEVQVQVQVEAVVEEVEVVEAVEERQASRLSRTHRRRAPSFARRGRWDTKRGHRPRFRDGRPWVPRWPGWRQAVSHRVIRLR